MILQGRKTTLEEAFFFECSDSEQVELLSSCETSEEKKTSPLGRLVPQAKQIGIAVECFTCYDFQQQCRSVRAAAGVEAVLLYPSLLVCLNH